MTRCAMTAATPHPSEILRPIRAAAGASLALIGPRLHGGLRDPETKPVSPAWICALSFTSAVGLLIVTLGHGAGLRQASWTLEIYWSGTVLMLAPLVLRVSRPDIARGERLCLLVVLAETLVLSRIVYYPLNIVHHDEILHWVASDDIMTARQLFLSNSLLHVGPTYPALEIIATAMTNLTGLSVYVSAMLLLAVLKAAFVSSLFLMLERLTRSARVAGIGCVVYAGSPTFVGFHTAFSYESLGVVLCALAFSADAVIKDHDAVQRRRWLLLLFLLLATLAVTHHLSAAFGAIYLGGLALVERWRRDETACRGARRAVYAAGLGAVALPLIWMQIRGTPVQDYLGPVIENGVDALADKLRGVTLTRADVPDPTSQPIGVRISTILGTALIAAGLASGFFRTIAMSATPMGATPVKAGTTSAVACDGWTTILALPRTRCWCDSRLIVLAFIAFGYPVSVVLRLSAGGWEVGNRMSTFVFFAVSLVVGVGVVHLWQGRTPGRLRVFLTGVSVSAMVMSGVTSAALSPIRSPYQVVADAQSIEAMGVQTALWTRDRLGPGNRFAADRINRLLLAGYGRQDVRIDVAPGVASSRLFLSDQVDPDEQYALASGGVDFLLADLRLTTNVPLMGHYYEPWEMKTGSPVTAEQLLKYNAVERAARIYDNGYIVIYDVRGLHDR